MTQYTVHISFFAKDACKEFLESEKGKKVQKIYVAGEDVRFGENCFQRYGTASPFLYFVDTKEVKQNLMEALQVSTITDIESLKERIETLEKKIEEGFVFPEGMSYQKETGLELKGNHYSLIIRPDSLMKNQELIDLESHKISEELYSVNNGLPDGMTFDTENGLQLRASNGATLRINPSSLPQNQELIEEGKVNPQLYDSSFPEGLSYNATSGVLQVGSGDVVGGLVLNNSLAITNLPKSEEMGTENNLVLLQPKKRYYQAKDIE